MLLKKYSSLIKEARKYYGVIYKITDLINNRIYIGQTMNLHRRLKEYEYKSKRIGNNKRSKWGMLIMINNIGVGNIMFDIIDYADNQIELKEKETKWIQSLRSHDPGIGYNIFTGFNGEMLCGMNQRVISTNKKIRITFPSSYQYDAQQVIMYKSNRFMIFDSIGQCAQHLDTIVPVIRRALIRAQFYKGHLIFYYDIDKRNTIIDKMSNMKIIRDDYRRKKKIFIRVGQRLNGLNLETIENYFYII